ncbi:MAG TPA: MobV family relaxase [Pyrinomonadaceae bacterium]
MPKYAILGIHKQKGGSITLSGRHNDRTQPVPNADPERAHLNRVLAGDDRPTRELVTEIIKQHGGKPRKDSVEAVEYLCEASPQFFNEKDPQKYQEKVDAFVEQAMKFLQDERSGGKLAKAVLHMDEHTPHIHAHKVPIDPAGNLNNKHYLGGRDKWEGMHDLYAEYMKPLGLERGERRSRATHVRIEDFYKSIDAPVRLEVDHDEIPDPPKVILTEEARRKYKDKVIRAVLKGLEEPHKIMRDQAMLARHERGQREEAERKAEERVQATERAAKERVAEVERLADDRFKNLLRSAQQLVDDNRGLRRENHDLLTERNELHESVMKLRLEKQEFELEAKQYRERLSDIPMHEVMERMGYKAERQGEAHVYRDTRGQVAIRIEGQKAEDYHRLETSRNSLDLILRMRRHYQGVEGFTEAQAIEFLREEFGDGRAAGAVMAHREQTVLEFFERSREERERNRFLVPQRGDDPWRGSQGRAEDQGRGSRGGGSDDQGGGRSYRGGR